MSSSASLSVEKQVERGISILLEGGIVAYPTDTLYGLGASASLPQAIERVYKVKNRPLNMPLPLLLADASQIAEFAQSVPPITWLLVESFMPGALTIVLPKSDSVSDIITGGGATVAVRIPAHPIPIALVRGLGTAIVGTSANLSGRPSPLTADEVYSQLGNLVNLIIDGGRCPGGVESTVVDVTGPIPMVLREGAISVEALKKVCGNIVLREVK